MLMLIGMLFCGLVMGVVGYLVKEKRCLWLLSEYRAGWVADEEGCARWTGNCLYGMAGVAAAFGMLFLVFPGHELVITLVMGFVFMALSIRVLAGRQRYMRKPGSTGAE